MDRATAQGLAAGGALLVALSLALPWYSLQIDEPGFTGASVSASGWESLGELKFLLLLLAGAMAWRANQLVSAGAALALFVIVGLRYSSPPGVEELLLSSLPSDVDPLLTAFAKPMIAQAVAESGVSLAPAWGMFAAAGGAALGIVAALGYNAAGVPSRATSAA